MTDDNKIQGILYIAEYIDIDRSCTRCSEPFKISEDVYDNLKTGIFNKLVFLCSKCGNRQVERW